MDAQQSDVQQKKGNSSPKRTPVKIVLLGESGVGKSSIAHR